MDTISYEYTRQRQEFGHHPAFADSEPQVQSVPAEECPQEDGEEIWVESAVTTLELDCTKEQSEHWVNTERYVQKAQGVTHVDGAWPKELKSNEFADKQRFLRRIENEQGYQHAVLSLSRMAEQAIQQNNTIDLFESYFDEMDEHHEATMPSAKTMCVFRDPNEVKRAATKISWHPEGPNKLAVSYSILQFQQAPESMPVSSYIWDVNNPNQPDSEIIPTSSSLSCLVFNPRSPDHLVGGSYNGLIGFWDLRKGSDPHETSKVELSHHDPVYDVFWIQSRSGNECCSISTDGQLLWWDVRKLVSGPTDSMSLLANNDDKFTFGGTSMEYKSDAGATRYLVGTEQGKALLVDRKAKKDMDSVKAIKAVYGQQDGAHHGPIYSIQRNPLNLKYFLTVGDWTARLWMEDLKKPIMTTKYDSAYLTSGCWSPTRPGVFFTTKADGTLDIWDLLHKHNEPAFSTKVGESGLTSMKVQNQGKLVALGSQDGTTTILELSQILHESQPSEKSMISSMFDRETKRERNLDIRAMQRKRDDRGQTRPAEMTADERSALRDQLTQVEADFYAQMNDSDGSANVVVPEVTSIDVVDSLAQKKAPEEQASRVWSGDSAATVTVGCRNLPRKNWEAKSDPLVAMFVKGSDGTFEYMDQTEWLKNDLSPDFRKQLLVESFDGTDKQLKFSVYDCDSDELSEKDRIGSAVVSLNHLLTQPNNMFKFKLQKKQDDQAECGTLVLKASVVNKSDVTADDFDNSDNEDEDGVGRFML